MARLAYLSVLQRLFLLYRECRTPSAWSTPATGKLPLYRRKPVQRRPIPAIVSGVCTRKSWAKWAAAASASSRDTSPALTTASRRFSNDNLEKSKPGERELMIEQQPGVHQVQLALR
jgi:hypothetical protein